MIKDFTHTYGVPKSKLMRLVLTSAPSLNTPYYFQNDAEITNHWVTGIELVEAYSFGFGNVSNGIEGFTLLDYQDLRSACAYFADDKGVFCMEQYPVKLFNGLATPNKSYKKRRTRLKVDPSNSYVIFKQGIAASYPALLALNVTLSEK